MAVLPFSDRTREFFAKAAGAALFAALSVNLLHDYQRTGHVTGILLLVNEALVVLLTLIRRPAQIVDRSALAVVVTTLSLGGPFLLRAGDALALAPDQATALLSAFGLVLVASAKMALGRSFGLVPANRGVVVRGPYRAMRHPIYAGYIVVHLAFLIAHPSLWNVTVAVIADSALLIRALMEEKVLLEDAGYKRYCEQVSWHVLPGVF